MTDPGLKKEQAFAGNAAMAGGVLSEEFRALHAEEMAFFDSERETIKQTVLISVTLFAALAYLLASREARPRVDVFLLAMPVLFLMLTAAQFYGTLYRAKINRWIILHLEPTLRSVIGCRENSFPHPRSGWQSFYRRDSRLLSFPAVLCYRTIPLFVPLVIECVYWCHLRVSGTWGFGKLEFWTPWLPAVLVIETCLTVLAVLIVFVFALKMFGAGREMI